MKASQSVLNCRWSLENEQDFEQHGGANQTVKAVLEVLGTNYIVEKWVSEDGTQKYQRWADGKIECFIRIIGNATLYPEITFPIAYQTPPVVTVTRESGRPDNVLGFDMRVVTTTSVIGVWASVVGDTVTISDFDAYVVGY